MRSFRLLALLAAPALLALLPAPSADAGECGPYAGHPAVRGGAVHCNRSGTCYVRDRCHPSTRYVIPRHRRGSCGCNGYVRPRYGPWSSMRRHMTVTRYDIRRHYVRNYFLRRYPFCLEKGQTIEEAARLDVLLAIGDEDAGMARALDDQGLLDRGTARFHVGDYDGARKDFGTLLAKNPKEHRARIGLAMVEVVGSKWAAAAKQLDVLAGAGELRAEDRFDIESLFADRERLTGITKSLKDTVGYRTTDAKAHVVTAWLLVGQDDLDGAKRFVKLAKRWGGATPARTALEENLGMKPKTAEKPPKAPETETAPQVRPPNPALHRQVAQVTRPNR